MAYTEQRYSGDSSSIPCVADTYQVIMALGPNQIRLSVFDTAGQENMTRLRSMQVDQSLTFILCFACNYRQSFKNITSFWMPEIMSSSKEARIILCGTKSDIFEASNKEHVSLKEARNLGKRIQASKTLFCSSKDYVSSIEKKNAREGNIDEVLKAAIKTDLKKQGLLTDEWISRSKCCLIL